MTGLYLSFRSDFEKKSDDRILDKNIIKTKSFWKKKNFSEIKKWSSKTLAHFIDSKN